jgi:hypothetical protein
MLRKQSFLAGTARSVLSNHGGLVWEMMASFHGKAWQMKYYNL